MLSYYNLTGGNHTIAPTRAKPILKNISAKPTLSHYEQKYNHNKTNRNKTLYIYNMKYSFHDKPGDSKATLTNMGKWIIWVPRYHNENKTKQNRLHTCFLLVVLYIHNLYIIMQCSHLANCGEMIFIYVCRHYVLVGVMKCIQRRFYTVSFIRLFCS